MYGIHFRYIYLYKVAVASRHHHFRENIIALKLTSYCFGVTYQSGVSPSVNKTQGLNRLCSLRLLSTDIISTIVLT